VGNETLPFSDANVAQNAIDALIKKAPKPSKKRKGSDA
jgi:hypothetical protein